MTETKKMVKEEVGKAVKKEILSILEDAGKKETVQIPATVDPTSMAQLLSEEIPAEPTEKVFGGEGAIFDVLNQTADEFINKGKSAIPQDNGINEQKEFRFNTNNMNAKTGNITPQMDASAKQKMIDKMGYGDNMANRYQESPQGQIPVEQSVSKLPVKIAQPRPSDGQPLQSVQVPTINADGKPINLDKVNPDVVQSMMRNYSGFMKKMDDKIKFTRGN